MTTNLASDLCRHTLHLSYSQLTTYLTCSQRYYFRYVAGLPPETVSSALILGSSFHSTLARFYDRLRAGQTENPSDLADFFQEDLARRLATATAPVQYSADSPTAQDLMEQGQHLLTTFLHEAPHGLVGLEIVAVELPLSVPLVDTQGLPMDIQLVGVIDLLLKDTQGNLVAVDHKTSRSAYTESSVTRDLQFSAYAVLLAGSGYLSEGAELACRFDVLRKLKTPKLEILHTRRTLEDQARFLSLAHRVLQAIECEVYLTCPGWSCAACAYTEACRNH